MKNKKNIENPEITPANHSDVVDSAAADITSSIEHNQHVANLDNPGVKAPPNPPKPKSSNWKSEPLANFEVDKDGKLKTRRGRPIRRGGRPRQPQHGDPLAGGGKYEDPDAVVSGQIVDPLSDNGQNLDHSPGSVELGEDISDVVVQGVNQLATKAGGEDEALTEKEKNNLGRAAAATFGGVRIPGWLMLTGVVGMIALTRIFARKKPPKDAQQDNTHIESGNDPIGKVDAGKATSYVYQ